LKNYALGFLSCLCLVLIMGMAPPINIKTNEEANLYKFLEKPFLDILTSTPSYDSMREGQISPIYTNNCMTLMVKGKGRRHFVTLTQIP